LPFLIYRSFALPVWAVAFVALALTMTLQGSVMSVLAMTVVACGVLLAIRWAIGTRVRTLRAPTRASTSAENAARTFDLVPGEHNGGWQLEKPASRRSGSKR
jgi:hypothetical protein